MHLLLQSSALCLVLGAHLANSQVTTNCPLLGPAFPAPTAPATAKAVRKAQSTFPSYLNGLLRTGNTEFGPLDSQTTSFSINVFSAHDNNSLFSYHHAAPGLNGSLTSGRLDDNTLYRIGSLSKLLTVYTILAEVGDANLDSPVTKFVPELAAAASAVDQNDVNNIKWDEITVRALGSHMSGLPRDYSAEDVIDLGVPVSDLSDLGLPTLNSSEVASCGASFETSVCSRQEFLKGMLTEDPFNPSFNTPLYSNAAIQVLAYALEGMTNKSFADSFNSALVQPLNLTRTFLSQAPDRINAIIPGTDNDTFWGFDLGDESVAGGMYSNLAELAVIGRSILRSSLLEPVLTRKWMKPLTHTSDLHASVGMPWEIQRMDLPLTDGSNVTRVVDLYTKSGDVGAYGSYIVLDPDHDIGFSIFAAGANPIVQSTVVADLIAATWIPAFEAAAREQAQTNYAGSYRAADHLNSSITIGLSNSRPGLGVESWISNGTDMLKAYGNIPTVGATAKQTVSARLYPAGLQSGNQQAFRAAFELLPQPRVGKVFSANCGSWVDAGTVSYGEVAFGDFVVGVQPKTGKAISVSPKALRVVLERE